MADFLKKFYRYIDGHFIGFVRLWMFLLIPCAISRHFAAWTAKQQLFEALKADYLIGKLRSDRADSLTRVISESTQNPEAFWGSAKMAGSNQNAFVNEKSERLFEELLSCWKAKECEAIK